MDDLLTQGLRESFTNALLEALKQVHDLEASVGASLAEMEAKLIAKRRLDRALAPFKIVAAAWTGGVMLGGEQCDDPAYAWLLSSVSETGDVPDDLASEPRLLRMIARGLGVEAVPSERLPLLDLSASEACIPALSYELIFPEVFFPRGEVGDRAGFDAVLGNPPWDRVRPFVKEFYAGIDISVLDAPTKRERDLVLRKLEGQAEHRAAFEDYAEEFTAQGRLHDAKFRWQSVRIGEVWAGRGNADAYCLFAEAGAYLLKSTGYVGFVLPSAFHANEGATGIRRLYLNEMALRCCYSFENRRKLFEIHRSFKFATVVASRTGPTTEFPCAFYLHDDEWLFGERGDRELHYSLDFVRRTGGEYLSLLELRSQHDLEVANICFRNGEPFGQFCDRIGIRLGVQADMTRDAWRFASTSNVLPGGEDPRDPDVAQRLLEMGYLVLHEGKTFHQFTDRWEDRPRYLVAFDKLRDKSAWLKSSLYYRLAFRAIARSTDDRTCILCMVPAGIVFGNSAPCEREPQQRPHSTAILVQACLDSFSFDWMLRQKSAANINLFILNGCTLPPFFQSTSFATCFITHSALRLTCNHTGYDPLWREQLGEIWREPKPPFTWPVLEGDDERWAIRAAIDAVVANAYGLSREQYAHVLSTFSHRSYPKAPELCLACYDDLKTNGLEVFTQKYDPYWDIPLNENLPEPVIQLPISEAAPVDNDGTTAQEDQLSLLAAESGVSWNVSPPPRTSSSKPAVSPRTATVAADDDTYELLKLLLEEQGVITSADAQDLTGLDAAGVRYPLKRLVDDGIAVQEGQRRGTRYRRTEG